MKHTLAIALFCALPALANATPRDRDGQSTQAEQEHRRDMRVALGEIKEKYPRKFEHLMKMREDDPAAFRKAMGEIMRQKKMGTFGREHPEIKTEKARLKELKEDFRAALEDHQGAADADKAEHRKELLQMAEEIFESKQKLRRMRVQIMRDDLNNLETEIEERDAQKDDLINDFVDNHIGDNLKGL